MNSRDRYEIIGLCKISHSIKQPCRSVCLKKSVRNAYTLAKQSEKLNILIYSKLLKIQASPNFRLPACHKIHAVPLSAGLHIFHRLCIVAGIS